MHNRHSERSEESQIVDPSPCGLRMTRVRGITLLEVLFAVTIIAFLVTTISGIYIITLRALDELGRHSNLHEKVSFTIERMSREVRPANAIQVQDHMLRYTVSVEGVDTSFVYYLYNPNDCDWDHDSGQCSPHYDQSSYDLKKTNLTNIGAVFAYGNGEIILKGLKPPPDTTMTQDGNSIVLLLTAQEEQTTFQARSRIHVRNA